ncbi:MAG: Wzy polymerase domain-containing protein [Hydrogenophaga sp.]|jgi:O-antigen ligase
MWPDLFAWTVGAVLLFLLPSTGARRELALVSGWLIAALGSTLLGLMQYFDLENGFYPWIAPTMPGYVTANVHQLNMLATLLAVGLLCVWWMVVRRGLATVHVVWMAALLLVTLAATASRTGVVHLLAISCMLLLWHSSQWRKALLILVVGWTFYAIAANGLPMLAEMSGISVERQLFDRFSIGATCHSRRLLWSNVVDLIAAKPWMGWGPGELLYAHYATDFGDSRFCEKLSHAHNLPLQLAFTMGIPIAVIACTAMVYFVWRLRPWQALHPTERLCWGVVALISLHSLLEYPLWFGVFQLMALLAGWQIYLTRGGGSELVTRRVSAGARACASALLLAILAFIAWEYLKVSQLYLPESKRLESYREDTFNKSRDTVLFNSHVLIAQVIATELQSGNAELILAGGLASLHTAPDARIIRRVIEAAKLLGRTDLAQLHETRFRAAWPEDYAEWKKSKDHMDTGP